jgi:FtsZ-interacting cell division protein ZipA
MGQYSGAHMDHYVRLLVKSQNEGTVGINQHMKLPTEPTSRLGFRGKKAKKSDLKLIAAKMVESAKKDPRLLPAALNAMNQAGSAKQEHTHSTHKERTSKAQTMSVEEARKLLAQIEAVQPQPKAEEPSQPKQVEKVRRVEAAKPEPKMDEYQEYQLRQKLLKEQKAKMAATLKVEQYGRNVFLHIKNSVG